MKIYCFLVLTISTFVKSSDNNLSKFINQLPEDVQRRIVQKAAANLPSIDVLNDEQRVVWHAESSSIKKKVLSKGISEAAFDQNAVPFPTRGTRLAAWSDLLGIQSGRKECLTPKEFDAIEKNIPDEHIQKIYPSGTVNVADESNQLLPIAKKVGYACRKGIATGFLVGFALTGRQKSSSLQMHNGLVVGFGFGCAAGFACGVVQLYSLYEKRNLERPPIIKKFKCNE